LRGLKALPKRLRFGFRLEKVRLAAAPHFGCAGLYGTAESRALPKEAAIRVFRAGKS